MDINTTSIALIYQPKLNRLALNQITLTIFTMGIQNTQISNCYSQLNHWHEEQIYFNTNNYFNHLLNDINNATKSIEIESYRFEPDKLGNLFIQCLMNAVKRKVIVKIIIDGIGSLSWNSTQIKQLLAAGIEVKIYHPLPWKLSIYTNRHIHKKWLVQFVDLFLKINKRDHRKLYVIDQKIAWSGSINLSGDHLASNSATQNWFDCGVRVNGNLVIHLTESFYDIWKPKHHYKKINKTLPFRTNNQFIQRQFKNFELVRLIGSSVNTVWIINAYLVPSRLIIKALKKAKQQGANVKLLISQHSDVIFFPLVSSAYYQLLLKHHIEVYECETQFIHAKTILIDDLLMVGSSNLNHRSFLHDLELDIILTQPNSINQFKQKFEQLLACSRQITAAQLSIQPWYKQLTAKMLWLFRYWL